MKAKRIGANQQRHIAEKRAMGGQDSKVTRRRVAKALFVLMFAALAGIAVFKYSPEIFISAVDTVKASKRLHTNIAITNCSKTVQASLKQALDSLSAADSFLFDRAGAVKAASMISGIEKISICKVRDKKKREMTTLVKVTERKPVALVHNGGFCLIDNMGVRFTAAPGQYYDLPLLIVEGKAACDTVDLDIFNRIKKASRLLGAAFFPQISQIDVSVDDAVNLIFKSGEAEYILSPDDIEEKMIQVKKLREKLLEEGSGFARIDMRYHRLAVTLAQ